MLICVTFSLLPGVRGWLGLLLVALPGLFYLPFCTLIGYLLTDGLRLFVPLVSFGTPWPNKQNHKTLHFQNFLNEKFIAASIKITVFKIKSHFSEYSSVILSLSIILTEICIFS